MHKKLNIVNGIPFNSLKIPLSLLMPLTCNTFPKICKNLIYEIWEDGKQNSFILIILCHFVEIKNLASVIK